MEGLSPNTEVSYLLWTIDLKPVGRNLEFFSGVAKGHEGQNPDENANRLGVCTFQAAHIHSLAIVTQPIAKVAALDQHARPFFASQEGNGLEHILDI